MSIVRGGLVHLTIGMEYSVVTIDDIRCTVQNGKFYKLSPGSCGIT